MAKELADHEKIILCDEYCFYRDKAIMEKDKKKKKQFFNNADMIVGEYVMRGYDGSDLLDAWNRREVK